MGKLKITEKKLLKVYNKMIDAISDDLEFKTHFEGYEICDIVHSILVENDINIMSSNNLYKQYSAKVKSLNITDEEWRKNYGVAEIISLIYKILEKNNN